MKARKALKRSLRVAAILVGFVGAASLQAAGRLAVELRQADDRSGSYQSLGDGTIELVLKNEGDRTIEVLKGDIPEINKRGELTLGVLQVVDADGNEVRYRGIIVDYDESLLRTLRIPPKQTMVTQISLVRNYAVAADHAYSVSLNRPVRYLDRPRELVADASKENLIALMKMAEVPPRISIRIDPRTDVRSLRILPVATAPQLCNSEQVALFNAAKSTADAMSREALVYTASLYRYELGNDGTVVGYFADSPRYIQWFGTHGSPFDPIEMDPVNDEINLGLITINFRISDDQSVPKPVMTVTCQCTAEDADPEASAWVRPDDHYVVNTCERFWQSPHLPTARDENSKVGTILHEAVHFSDAYWSGSQSHHAVSYTAAMDLAITNRALSAKNPNSYKFYILNQAW